MYFKNPSLTWHTHFVKSVFLASPTENSRVGKNQLKKKKETKRLLQVLPSSFHQQNRPSWVWSHSTYPLTDNTHFPFHRIFFLKFCHNIKFCHFSWSCEFCHLNQCNCCFCTNIHINLSHHRQKICLGKAVQEATKIYIHLSKQVQNYTNREEFVHLGKH